MPVVAFFGGSFNPPHIGHVLAVAYVLATEEVDEVRVVPCFRHPFAKDLVPFEHRFAMCELAMGWLPRVTISRVEEELGGESRTLRTIEHLYATEPDKEFRLVIGADVLAERSRWHGFERLEQLAPFILLGRAGTSSKEAPSPVLPEVSSTAVRDALRSGSRSELEALVPRAVLSYIDAHGLYRNEEEDD